MKYVMAFAVAMLLSGCAGAPVQFAGTKPGGTQANFSNDFLECQIVAKRIVGPREPFQTSYGDSINRTIHTCMQGKGWTMTSPKYD